VSGDFVDRLAVELRSAAAREAARPRRFPLAPVALAVGAVAGVAVIVVLALRPGGEAAPPPLRVLERLQLAGNPGPATAAYGSVWIPDNVAGVVLRVNPRTRALQARFRVGSGQPFALAAGGGAVWAPARNGIGVVRIDARTNRLTHRMLRGAGSPLGFFAAGIVAGAGAVWAVGPGGALRLDPASGKATTRAAAGSDVGTDWAAIAGGTFWLLASDGRLYALDPATGRQRSVADTRAAGADPILGDRSGIVAGGGATLVRLGPDGTVKWQQRLGVRVNQFAEQGSTLWVHVTERRPPERLVALDAANGSVLSSLPVPTFGATGMTVVGAEIWLDTPVGETLILGRQRTS
jgi:streptogramin lyase